ncbi:MAG TPA: M1 family metallopeptidase [Chitinophaga sp.]|nr:M1 family metallopeptidase [Chitinophaga sp.]
MKVNNVICRIAFSSMLFLGMLQSTSAQDLYMPRNIKKAYTKGTRDISGKPGRRYWQNRGSYAIDLRVQPPSRTVYGEETIQYVNNSPDTLRYVVLRLICNIHKPQAPRSGYTSSDFLTKGVIIDTLVINGTAVSFSNDVGTVANVQLPQALEPGGTTKFSIRWHYDMSVLSGREGCIDSTTFYLAYSYPRISVYDDYNGWDRIEHSDRVEFYSDFNDYKVAVTVPANYVVWGTGVLQNVDEVLQPAIAGRLKSSYTSDIPAHIATASEMRQHQVTRQHEWNTWRFKADNIADVTYGLSDHYVWDAASVVVDSTAHRRASVQAAYNETATDFRHSVEYARYALNWFSHNWPGVAYPFPVMTAFQGYADMEYPMMVNDATVGDNLTFARLVQDHEIAHTWFPFYMGINESRYAFMDEGWATTLEYLIGLSQGDKAAADKFYKEFRVDGYINDPSAEEDQPIISMSNQVSGRGYGNNAYGKPSLAYLALKDMLGDARFKKCLHAYMDNWNGKHPIPWDFFNSFNTASGQQLNWFWNNWFFSNNYIDIGIKNVQPKNGAVSLSVINTGGFAIPFDIIINYNDGSSDTVHQTPSVWKQDSREAVFSIPTGKKEVAGIRVDGNLFMDAEKKDNEWKR